MVESRTKEESKEELQKLDFITSSSADRHLDTRFTSVALLRGENTLCDDQRLEVYVCVAAKLLVALPHTCTIYYISTGALQPVRQGGLFPGAPS